MVQIPRELREEYREAMRLTQLEDERIEKEKCPEIPETNEKNEKNEKK
jgi:hypothetical protein